MTTHTLQRDGAAAALPPFVEKLLGRWLGSWAIGKVTVHLPRGRLLTFGAAGGPEAELTIHNMGVLWRVMASGDLGWAEGYMAGEWDARDLTAFLTLGARNIDALARNGASGTVAARAIQRVIHGLRANTRAGSRRNIAAHYDLGNDFYRLWLDRSMTYSSALFESRHEPLETAQRRKYRRICALLDLKNGDHVLEVGCGWGGFAEIAARDYGCRVTALTVSQRQADFARARMERLGLGGKVEIRLQDYRDINERYTAIASIEMFEAVGAENWPTYFEAVHRALAPGGRAAIQTITIADERFDEYRRAPDFIQRYIFPGGVLPNATVFRNNARAAGFTIKDEYFFGVWYAETLRRWAGAFNAQWPAIAPLGFDERFRRMWNYYLSYCEAGFATKHVDVAQFLLQRGASTAV